MHLSLRGDRKRFVVSIFLADDAVEFPQTDRLSIPLTRLYGGTIYAEDAKWAAQGLGSNTSAPTGTKGLSIWKPLATSFSRRLNRASSPSA